MPALTPRARQLVERLKFAHHRSPAPHRGHHPGLFWLALTLSLMTAISGCEDANASESSRTYRPLNVSCPALPRASGDALQPTVFFDDEEALSDDEVSEDERDELDPLDAMLATGQADDSALLLDEHATDAENIVSGDEEHDLLLDDGATLLPDLSAKPAADLLDALHTLEATELDASPADEAHALHATHHPHVEAGSEQRPEPVAHPQPTADADADDEDHEVPDARTPSSEPAEADAPIQKININTATEAELTSIRGIGPALAGRILDYRSRRPFTRLSHLKRVKGIGPATYRRLQPYITLDDAPDAGESDTQN
ncbi:helix-hairpin-helix domain-containing protein [Lujinxingia vulgaris]|uniref:Helix-hairpin-helix domain-containing protein n=1 Tax=Lujinxingia vulgaris TaxID=2600176 RepID=A0A5C6X139_9DELT|nr:ComEA family DNA-binding protein [Lujinxingia vulgaris]TXD35549.1 helix-hairpin-helix domain-containing protein [Lujinxingia vulgaris]